MSQFVYFLLDNYYPKVGWRWIGANHAIFYNILILVLNLLQLGYWRQEDMSILLNKLFNVSEILIVLEKNTIQDSVKLA